MLSANYSDKSLLLQFPSDLFPPPANGEINGTLLSWIRTRSAQRPVDSYGQGVTTSFAPSGAKVRRRPQSEFAFARHERAKEG
jgi:hypothetical protein